MFLIRFVTIVSITICNNVGHIQILALLLGSPESFLKGKAYVSLLITVATPILILNVFYNVGYLTQNATDNMMKLHIVVYLLYLVPYSISKNIISLTFVS